MEKLPPALEARILAAQPGFDGWCTKEKSLKLAEYIWHEKPFACVELGVYGGASFFPIAFTLHQIGAGKVIGVDPWSVDACLEGMNDAGSREFWGTRARLELMYHRCCDWAKHFGLESHVELVRARSEEYVKGFGDNTIDFIHIDGNHSAIASMRDATLYLPKVRVNSVIAFDDKGWVEVDKPTTVHAINYLKSNGCEEIDMVGDCLILRKIK